jgi:hypothetical protein
MGIEGIRRTGGVFASARLPDEESSFAAELKKV